MTRSGFDLFNDLFFNDNFLRPYYSTTRGTSSPATNAVSYTHLTLPTTPYV